MPLLGCDNISTVVPFGMLSVFHPWYSDLDNEALQEEKKIMQLNLIEASLAIGLTPLNT